MRSMIDYPKLVASLRSRPTLTRAINATNTALTWLGYLSYGLLLIVVAMVRFDLLLESILVPGASFTIVTIIRSGVNETRPYARLGYEPLIPKANTGKSFPSRHAFCMFMIAASWLNLAQKTAWAMVPIDVFALSLFASALLLAVIRVASGVHYLKDVIAGALFALILAHIGYMMVFA